jgi:hypothetical protein
MKKTLSLILLTLILSLPVLAGDINGTLVDPPPPPPATLPSGLVLIIFDLLF